MTDHLHNLFGRGFGSSRNRKQQWILIEEVHQRLRRHLKTWTPYGMGFLKIHKSVRKVAASTQIPSLQITNDARIEGGKMYARKMIERLRPRYGWAICFFGRRPTTLWCANAAVFFKITKLTFSSWPSKILMVTTKGPLFSKMATVRTRLEWIISRFGDILWHPRSPDLTLFNFSL